MLSGIAQYHKDGGVITKDKYGNSITISFPTNSFSYVVERRYQENGQKFFETEYQNGQRHGKKIWWDKNGKKYLEAEFQNGKMINAKYC